MSSKIELENKAKSLIENDPKEAVLLYEQIWTEYNDQFNIWDAVNYVKGLRKSSSHQSEIISEALEKFKEEERFTNMYGWYIFDRYVNHKENKELIQHESIILKLFEVSGQKDLSADQRYPCPVTISLIKLSDAFADNLFNANKVNETLSLLNPDFLSTQSRKISTEKRDIELASDREKYYALKTKALVKLKMFEECIELCDIALEAFGEFHYNNDLWFMMRKAISLEHLGRNNESEDLFHRILSTKAGSDKWFIYRDIAELYFEQKDYDNAWKYSVDAAHYGNEAKFMIKLFLLQARILYKIDRKEEGEILAFLIASVLRENDWSAKREYEQLFKFYGVRNEELLSVNEYLNKAKDFWRKERYKQKEKVKGKIVGIHGSGKKGIIITNEDSKVSFFKKDFKERVKDLQSLKGQQVEFFLMDDFEGKKVAEDIVLLNPRSDVDNSLVGKRLSGTVKNVVDFGVFIALPQMKDGLMHKNNMPKEFQNDFKTRLKEGDTFDVEIFSISPKGINLKLVQ